MAARTSWITARCGTSVSLIRPPGSWELRTVRSCRFPARARSGRSADSSHSRTHAEGAALQLRGVPDGRTRGVHPPRVRPRRQETRFDDTESISPRADGGTARDPRLAPGRGGTSGGAPLRGALFEWAHL